MKIVVINNYKELEKAEQAKRNLTKCTGQPLQVIDYKAPGLVDTVEEASPDLAILTGSNFMLSKSDTQKVFQPEMDLVRKLDIPFLGICFGHQLIGAAYGVKITDLGQTIRAFKEVTLLSSDPVFDGLPQTIRVSESHRQALTNVPKGFRHLAESSTSRVEAIAHETRPIYGVQFHPERSDDKNPHGQQIIRNFLKLVAES
ncbi:gamma-glutamyl-gamma-aminobutyrate hydrolase family protein [Candidatus Bathyarchaeota archaeon]|nr:gamma-glutamyl-gamma-aminobutyrate hydrolase family protein [Candidatus Bathyarchaeota archaeon]